MKHILGKCLALAIIIGCTTICHGIRLEIIPLSPTVSEGSSVSVALVFTELGMSTAPSVGTYDINLGYDASILAFSSLTFGDPVLGNQLDLSGFGAISVYDDSVPGTVNVFELSLDDPGTLDTLQADAFRVATLTFNTIGIGTGTFDLTANAIGDAWGNSLDVGLFGSQVTVTGSGVTVPDTGRSSGLLVLALSTLALFKRHRRSWCENVR